VSAWQAAIDRGGGLASAMLYGPPLKALVDELAATQMERDAAKKLAESEGKRIGAEAEALAQAERNLAAERAALVECETRARGLEARLKVALELVQAAKKEKINGVPSRFLLAAIEKYDQTGA